MDFRILLYAGLVLALTFLVRSLFRLLVGGWGSDVYSHLYFVDEIRKNRHRIPLKLSKTLTSGFFSYPFLVHWILSFIRRDWVKGIEPFFGAITDTVHNSFLFLSCAIILSGTRNGLEVAFLASMIFCFYPMLIKDKARTFALSPRVFGSMVFSVSTLLLFQFYWTGNYLFLVISIMIAPVIILSSKFAFQVMIFFFTILALFLKSAWFLLPIFVGVLLAFVLTKNLYFRVLKAHIRFLIFWKREIVNRYPIILEHMSLSKMLVALRKLKYQPRECLRIIYANPVVNAVAHNPFLVMWVLLFFVGQNYDYQFPGFTFWILSGLLIFSAFSFKFLAFLGEAERYLEYIVLPLSILSAIAMVNFGLFFFGLIFFTSGLLIILIEYRSSLHIARRFGYRKFEEVIDYLNTVVDVKNILVIPTFYTPQVAYSTHHKVVIFSDNLGSTEENEKEFLLVFPKLFDYPNENLKILVHKFDLDFIVARKRMDYNSYDFSKFITRFENEEFGVYGVANKSNLLHQTHAP